MNKSFIKAVFALSFLGATIFAMAYSQDEELNQADIMKGQITEGMERRLPRIMKLQDQGIIRESSTGHLVLVGTPSEETQDVLKLINIENSDRDQVYQIVADNITRETGIYTTAQDVGKTRANQLKGNREYKNKPQRD